MPVPMAGESGLECQTCQAVTGFAHDFREDAARTITVAAVSENGAVFQPEPGRDQEVA